MMKSSDRRRFITMFPNIHKLIKAHQKVSVITLLYTSIAAHCEEGYAKLQSSQGKNRKDEPPPQSC